MKMKTIDTLNLKDMWITSHEGVTPPKNYISTLIEQVKTEGRPEEGLRETVVSELLRQMNEAAKTTKKFEYVNADLTKGQIILTSIAYDEDLKGVKVQKSLYTAADKEEVLAYMINWIIDVNEFIDLKTDSRVQ